ncbi:carboxypeptidase-like regulatory domain-containing protein [Maribacter sp. 2307UL18-2]|uniref:carboxypeptidase-like regulatory domain-containing protein n=1 Tax=Maribacter sp. 2307UL18-2 TaxID=3386274 RepID=UPI0039BCBF50
MKNCLAIFLLMMTTIGFAQNQGGLRGTILDQEMHNEPLLFAHVQLKGVDAKTETNFHGNFEFGALESGEYTLVVTYAGYETIEMPIAVKADEITQVSLGMGAKQISLEGVAGLESLVRKEETVSNGAGLQKE